MRPSAPCARPAGPCPGVGDYSPYGRAVWETMVQVWEACSPYGRAVCDGPGVGGYGAGRVVAMVQVWETVVPMAGPCWRLRSPYGRAVCETMVPMAGPCGGWPGRVGDYGRGRLCSSYGRACGRLSPYGPCLPYGPCGPHGLDPVTPMDWALCGYGATGPMEPPTGPPRR